MSNPYSPGADTSDGVAAPDVSGGFTGSPISVGASQGAPTIAHTWLIIVLALLAIWFIFGGLHRKIRMG